MSEQDAADRPSPRTTIPIKPARTGRPDDATPPPVDGYDDMTALQVIRLLPRLSPAELEDVIHYETSHASRRSVMKEFRRYTR